MPFFSVIIPTFNRLVLLQEALDSVWRQTFSDYEVIVVDDGSTDGTREWLATAGDRIRVFVQPNRGPGTARNIGACEARGDYVAFLDSDDVWFPWTLQSYRKAIDQHGGPSMVAGTAVALEVAGAHLTAQLSDVRTSIHSCFFDAVSGTDLPIAGTPSITVRRDTFLRVGGFLEGRLNGEDTDLWFRLGVEPGFVRVESPPVFAQRVHDGNVTEDCERSLKGMEHIFRQESGGQYPGGATYRLKRIEVLAASARTVSLRALRVGRFCDAWRVYRSSFSWHRQLGRFKYLLGFPILLATRFAFRRRPHTQTIHGT